MWLFALLCGLFATSGPAYNVLWSFDTVTRQWAILSGTTTSNVYGVFGTLGVEVCVVLDFHVSCPHTEREYCSWSSRQSRSRVRQCQQSCCRFWRQRLCSLYVAFGVLFVTQSLSFVFISNPGDSWRPLYVQCVEWHVGLDGRYTSLPTHEHTHTHCLTHTHSQGSSVPNGAANYGTVNVPVCVRVFERVHVIAVGQAATNTPYGVCWHTIAFDGVNNQVPLTQHIHRKRTHRSSRLAEIITAVAPAISASTLSFVWTNCVCVCSLWTARLATCLPGE